MDIDNVTELYESGLVNNPNVLKHVDTEVAKLNTRKAVLLKTLGEMAAVDLEVLLADRDERERKLEFEKRENLSRRIEFDKQDKENIRLLIKELAGIRLYWTGYTGTGSVNRIYKEQVPAPSPDLDTMRRRYLRSIAHTLDIKRGKFETHYVHTYWYIIGEKLIKANKKLTDAAIELLIFPAVHFDDQILPSGYNPLVVSTTMSAKKAFEQLALEEYSRRIDEAEIERYRFEDGSEYWMPGTYYFRHPVLVKEDGVTKYGLRRDGKLPVRKVKYGLPYDSIKKTYLTDQVCDEFRVGQHVDQLQKELL